MGADAELKGSKIAGMRVPFVLESINAAIYYLGFLAWESIAALLPKGPFADGFLRVQVLALACYMLNWGAKGEGAGRSIPLGIFILVLFTSSELIRERLGGGAEPQLQYLVVPIFASMAYFVFWTWASSLVAHGALERLQKWEDAKRSRAGAVERRGG